VTVRAVLYDANGHDREIDLKAGQPKLGNTRFLWIDVDTRETDELSVAAEALGLEHEAFARLEREDRHARILRLPDRVVLTVGAIDPDDDQVRRREVDIVIGKNHVLTVHDGAVAAVDRFRDDISDEQELGRIDAAGFLAGLLDSIFTAYFRQIETIEREIDALDELAVRSRRDGAFLSTVLVLRRRIALLRRALSPNREALLPLERPDFELRTDLGVVWPGVIERLERAIDGVENARELLVGSFDLYLGRASQRTNDVMKALTLVSAVALPGVVLAGIMGMNFKLGFFDEPTNFFVVIAAMVLLSGAILAVARWRAWI
jgi:Mg2+ and Co2+ transporter CorA